MNAASANGRPSQKISGRYFDTIAVGPVEVVPNANLKMAFPVCQIFIAQNGLFIDENAATERLAAANVYEFAYIFNPLPVEGGTGSPGNALAAY